MRRVLITLLVLAFAIPATAAAGSSQHSNLAHGRKLTHTPTPTASATSSPSPTSSTSTSSASPSPSASSSPSSTATASPTPTSSSTPTPSGAWTRVFRDDFVDLSSVAFMQSGKSVNDTLSPSDTTNSLLQKPTLKGNVVITDDADAADGKAMAVWTRKGTYETSAGPVTGWTNGRMQITGQSQTVPVRIRVRLRMTASVYDKSAVMWWPNQGWPWEVDFAETFGGSSLIDYWGGRQHVGQRWHSDLNGDGAAIEQLSHDDGLDATGYHVYDLKIWPDMMTMSVDGSELYRTTDARYIPDSGGFYANGKALTGIRSATGRTSDAVFVDWLELYKPTP
jgi:hypothetical protein